MSDISKVTRSILESFREKWSQDEQYPSLCLQATSSPPPLGQTVGRWGTKRVQCKHQSIERDRKTEIGITAFAYASLVSCLRIFPCRHLQSCGCEPSMTACQPVCLLACLIVCWPACLLLVYLSGYLPPADCIAVCRQPSCLSNYLPVCLLNCLLATLLVLIYRSVCRPVLRPKLIVTIDVCISTH